MRNDASPSVRSRRFAGGIALAAAMAFASPAFSDTIYLKNDRKIVGIVDKAASDGDRMIVRTPNGTLPIPMTNIAKVEYDANSGAVESNADLAQAGGDFDKAMDLYLKAYQATPDNDALKKKIEDLTVQIKARDEKVYGAAFDQIEKQIAAGEFEAAIGIAEGFVARVRQPSALRSFKERVARARMGLARHFKDKVEYTKAEQQYKLAMEVYPEGPQAYFELGTLLQQAPSRKAQAIPLFQQGIEQARKDPEAVDEKTLRDYQYQLAQIYLQSQQFTQAADLFLDIARHDKAKAYPRALEFMADSYAKLDLGAQRDDIDRIIENLHAATATDPKFERSYVLLGRIYFQRKDWKQARDMLASAIGSTAMASPDRSMQEALYYLGVSYRKLGQTDQAAQVLQTIYNQGSPTYDVVCELAEVKLEQVSLQPALDLFSQARAADHDKYRAYLGLADTLILLKRYSEARDNYLEVIKRDPLNYPAQMAIAKTFYMDEMMAEAANQAQRAIDQIKLADPAMKEPETKRLLAETYTLLGEASLGQNQVNMGQDSFGKALAAIEDYPPALDGMGKAYQADGKYDEARKYFDRAIAAEPKNPDYRLSLAIFYHKYLKKTGDALPNYMAYLDLGGKDPNVRSWIADCGGTPPP